VQSGNEGPRLDPSSVYGTPGPAHMELIADVVRVGAWIVSGIWGDFSGGSLMPRAPVRAITGQIFSVNRELGQK